MSYTNDCEPIAPGHSIKVDMATNRQSCEIARNDKKEKGLDRGETTKKQKSGSYDHESSSKEDSTIEDVFL